MELDYKRALEIIEKEEKRGNNPIPDILGFLNIEKMYGDTLDSELHRLLDDYSNSNRNIDPLLEVDVPKSNFTIRPMARPVTKDWIIYESIIDYLSKRIPDNTQICSRSYSFKYFKKIPLRTTDPWLEFYQHNMTLIEGGFSYVIVTDITGYYENISLDELRNKIKSSIPLLDGEEIVIKVLFNLLRKWSHSRISGYGLPQGPPASGFLADIFLDYIDRAMEEYEGYFRYMDDIRVYCKSEIEAKKALKLLIKSLRNIKLNINAKKTDILSGDNIRNKIIDPKKSLMSMIVQSIESQKVSRIEEIIPYLFELFDLSFTDTQNEKRYLVFSLYRLGMLHNSGFEIDKDHLINQIINNFVSKPHHTPLFCDFLTIFKNNKHIPLFLIKYLQSDDNIYEWQETIILKSILRLDFKADRSQISFFINSARNFNKHFASRAFYYILAGKFGDNRDRDLIRDCYVNEQLPFVKTAIILGVQELEKGSRNDFFSALKQTENNNEIIKFIEYLKSLRKPIYTLIPKRPQIETYEDFEEPTYYSL